jgi:hypothetical protein
VLVVGGGNSACDIAVEAARFADCAHLSLRRGYWFLPKVLMGVPTVELLKPWMPLPLQRLVLRALLRLTVGPYEKYGLPAPDHRLFEHHPTVNSELLYFLRHGRVVPHPDVARLEGERVRFVDGSSERFDLIVCATGYDVRFPFLAQGLVRWKAGMPQLVGGAVSPEHRGLYLFGLGQPRYGAGPLISAGASLLCTLVKTQERLRSPAGLLLHELGLQAPTSWLQDPARVLRDCRRGQWLVPQLPRLEPWLLRRRERRLRKRGPAHTVAPDATIDESDVAHGATSQVTDAAIKSTLGHSIDVNGKELQ